MQRSSVRVEGVLCEEFVSFVCVKYDRMRGQEKGRDMHMTNREEERKRQKDRKKEKIKDGKKERKKEKLNARTKERK